MITPDRSLWIACGFRELRPGVLVHPDEPYVRGVIGRTYEGHVDYVSTSPYELASWVFPHEPEEDARREALARELVEAIEGRADPAEIARRWARDDLSALTEDIRTLVSHFRQT